MLHEPIPNFYNLSSGHSQSHPFGQPCRQHFIRQHSQMLRVVPEFHHIELPIGAPHKMSLRPPPHPSPVLYGFHQNSFFSASLRRPSAQAEPSETGSLVRLTTKSVILPRILAIFL